MLYTFMRLRGLHWHSPVHKLQHCYGISAELRCNHTQLQISQCVKSRPSSKAFVYWAKIRWRRKENGCWQWWQQNRMQGRHRKAPHCPVDSHYSPRAEKAHRPLASLSRLSSTLFCIAAFSSPPCSPFLWLTPKDFFEDMYSCLYKVYELEQLLCPFF